MAFPLRAVKRRHPQRPPAGSPTVPARRPPPCRELRLDQIRRTARRWPSTRVMSRGLAVRPRTSPRSPSKQARGDLIEADLPAARLPHHAAALRRHRADRHRRRCTLSRRISATFKDLPGGQVLGPTFDYTHRLLDFGARRAAAPRSPAPSRATPHAEPMPRVADMLGSESADRGLTARRPAPRTRRPHPRAAGLPVDRASAAAGAGRAATRAFCSASAIRRSAAMARTHPFAGEIRIGRRSRSNVRAGAGFRRSTIGEHHASPNARWSTSSAAAAEEPPQFTRGYGLVFGHGERKAMAMALGRPRAARRSELGEDIDRAGAGRGIRPRTTPTTCRRPASSST